MHKLIKYFQSHCGPPLFERSLIMTLLQYQFTQCPIVKMQKLWIINIELLKRF